MWTQANRHRYGRSKLRYPSDVSDEEWALVSAADPARQAGRQPAQGRRARGVERPDVRSEHGLPVAVDP